MLLFLLLLQWGMLAGSYYAAFPAAAWTLLFFNVQETTLCEHLVVATWAFAGVVMAFTATNIAFSIFTVVQILTAIYYKHKNAPPLDPWVVFDWLLWAVYIALAFFTYFSAFAAIAWVPVAVNIPFASTKVPWVLAISSVIGVFLWAVSSMDFVIASILLTCNIFSALSRYYQ